MAEIKAWPLPTGRPAQLPKQIVRPCDFGLLMAVRGLEDQLGTIEAYNRLVGAALRLRAQIDAGKAKPQLAMFAVDPRGAP